MKRNHSLLMVCVLFAATGCGAPRFFLDGALAPDDETQEDAGIPADPDVVEDAALAPEDALQIEGSALPDAAEREADVPADAADASTPVDSDTGMVPVDSGVDARADAARDSGPDARDGGAVSTDAANGCRSTADCNDGLADTRDICDVGGACRHERCDDGNSCTANVATETGCTFPVLPDGTTCRPGPTIFACRGGVCPSCGGENEVCCEWPGSTSVCSGTARCRTTAAGFRRCITCGGPGERCCLTTDGIMWASERCNSGLTCSSPPGVAGSCR